MNIFCLLSLRPVKKVESLSESGKNQYDEFEFIVKLIFISSYSGLKGVDVPEPPCLFVKYDCLLNVANIFIELYVNSSTTYCLASMYINFNDDDVQYLWKLEYREINEAQLDMRANSLELDWLNKAVGKREYVFI